MADKPEAPWMVYGVCQGLPIREHASEKSARNEAKRLAATHPGMRFRVVQVVCEVVMGGLTVTEFERDAIPF